MKGEDMPGIKIGINQALFNINGLNKTMDSLTQRLSTGEKINSSKDNPSAWVAASNSHSAFNRLQAINSGLNMVAMNIRVADTTMGTIGDYLDNMESQLDMIIKNYPPFPPGSSERADFLKGFNGLRKQIDQLTLPREEGAKKIMADPSVFPGAGDWEIIVGENSAGKTIHSRQVHTGPTGLNIPELPEEATDSEIAEAIANLRTAKITLEQKRAGLGFDAAGIARWQEHNTRTANFHQNRAERIENADMNEVAAQIKSVELRQALTIEVIRGITENQSQLIAVLR
jgi:flagellin-like hook-associated protein FlgL